MRWFLLVIGDLTSSLDGWRLFQYLSLIVLRVKEDSLLLSMVWWFASPYIGRLVKVAVRGYKLQKLAQHLSDIKGFILTGGTGSVIGQTSLDRLCQLTDDTQDPEEIMNLLENRISELETANNNRSLDQLVVVLGNLAGRARELQAGYDWFAVLLYLSTALGTVVIVRLWIGPPPSYGSPENYKALPTALVCTLVMIVHRRHPIRWDLEVPHGVMDGILANLTQPIQQEETRSTESILDDNHPLSVQQEETRSTGSILNANQPQPIQQEEPLSTENILDANHPQPVQQEQPRSNESILDANQVDAAIASIHTSMEGNHRQIIPVRSPQPELSDSDWDSSSSSDDEIIHYWHAPMNSLEAGDANLIDPDFMQMLQEMTGGLSAPDAAEIVRTLFRYASESDGSYRLSDINENQWILHAGTEAFANPPALTDISTQSFVMMSKITAKLCHLIWLELAGQNWQLCQEVRKECFLGVVGQSLQKLVDVAVSFCKARWSADYNLQMLTMFDGLIDVLYSIRDLPLDRYDFIDNKVAYIFQKMIYGIKRVIEGTADDIHVSNESSIHPATVVLLEVLEFLCRNSDMTQHLLDSEDYNTDPCSNIFDYWVSKLKKSARKMFPNKGQRFIFILNNLYFVLQKKCYQGVPLNLDSQIEKYIERYLDEYWVPLVRHLDGETHRSSLVYFAGKFENTCHTQMKWKVRTELKKILRDKIEILIVAKYANLFDTLQANPRWHWRFRFNGICRGRSQKPKTGLQVKQKIGALFEL